MKAGYATLHPSLLLIDELKSLGLTVGRAANKMRIKRKQLARVIYDHAPITPVFVVVK